MRVFILTRDPATLSQWSVQVRQVAPHCEIVDRLPGPGTHAAAEQAEQAVDVVLVDFPEDQALDLSAFQELRRRTRAWIVALGRVSSASQIVELLQNGIDSFIDRDRDLKPQLAAMFDNWTRHVGREEEQPRQMTAVISASGGNGASTLAANFAVCVAQRLGQCGLVDLDLVKPDMAALFNVKPKHSLVDLCQSSSLLDQNMVRQSMVSHDSGVHLLAGPDHLNLDVQPESEKLARICKLARQHFPVTLVDCGGPRDLPRYLELLRECSKVVVVARLDFTGLCHARRLLDECERAGIPETQIAIIANKSGGTNEIPAAKAKTILVRCLDACLPRDDEGTSLALNCGVPLLLEAPRRKLSRSIQDVAGTLFELPAPAAPAKSRMKLGRRFHNSHWHFVQHLAHVLLFAKAAGH